MREDLEFVRQTWQGRDYWIVKDPLTLRFFRFEEEEYQILQLLDGQNSADAITQAFAEMFAPQKLTNRELFQFIGSLYRGSLVVSDTSGQAITLKNRAEELRKRTRRNKFTNVLAFRLRGFDPGCLLKQLTKYFGWLFSTPAVFLAFLLMVSAVGLILTHFEQFQGKLPSFQEFFSGSNWLILGLTLACTKVIHELGHGIACTRFGSQCHSMGIMFLVLMPCLYCDVSDSWTLKSKWRRAFIAAAGMYFEFLLAAFCTFIWWFSEPGWINMLALNIVFVCSVSTFLFNANPLLKFDGYYILSDLIEIPNLRTKASSVLRRWMSETVLGIESRPDPFLPQKHLWLFGCYTICAFLYRWFITLSIFWFLYNLLEPYGLKLIGQMIAAMALWGLIGIPIFQLYRFLSVPGRFATVNRTQFTLASAIGSILLALILWVPLPHYVTCSFMTQQAETANVYVEIPGTLREIHVRETQWVQAGEMLVTLSAPELEETIAQLEGEEKITQQRYYSRKQQAHYDESAEADLEAQLASWQAVRLQLEQRRRDLTQLQIKSPIDGHVTTASYREAEPQDYRGPLRNWHGHPIEPRNAGAYLAEGTIVCQVAPQNKTLEITLAIDQADIEFVASGNPVELLVSQQPGHLYRSTVDYISPVAMEFVPAALSSLNGGPIAASRDSRGPDVPLNPQYQVKVLLDQPAGLIPAGSTGVARVRTGYQTLGARLWRLACATFRFDL